MFHGVRDIPYLIILFFIYKTGCKTGDGQVEELKRHNFFATINWEDLCQRKVEPPSKPTIVPDETFHFDSTFTSKTPKGMLTEELLHSW